MKEQFQQLIDLFYKPALGVERRTFGIHAGQGNRVFRADKTHLLDLVIPRFVIHQIGSRLVPFIGFLFQPVSFELQRLQVVLLYVHHFLGSLYDGAEYGIHRTQNDSREEHDTETEHERTEQRENIDRFGAGER